MRREIRTAIEAGVLAAVLVGLYFVIPRAGKYQADSGHRLVMGTVGRVIAVSADRRTANAAIEAAFKELKNIEHLMTAFSDDSEVAKVNREGFGKAVKVSEATFEVIRQAARFSKLSGGAFDITIGPLSELWRQAGEANSPPTEEQIAEARSRVGYEKLILDANATTVRFAVEGMKIDLGGIATGYGVDKAVEVMKEAGASGGLIDVGGDIRCFGVAPPGKECWMVGLQDPRDSSEEGPGNYLMVLKLKDAAVTTSGDYRKFVVVSGQRHSHIIDRSSGQSAQGLSSVTIIAETCTDADALATAVSVMGAERGLALIEGMTETEAILITDGPGFEMKKTSGADKYISN